MHSRRIMGMVLVAATLLLLTPFATATINACDSYGQDWQLNLAVFGGTYPSTQVVTGCRDCDNSLGCGGPLILDGTLVKASGGASIFSTTAYSPAGSSCFSTHWSGKVSGGNTITGNVSNNNGPFGSYTLTAGNCAAAARGNDPAHGGQPTWKLPE
ncbi:MAG TPA: hypothetical protein VMP68_18725 [Candidatus Eisenbacteria bacterium]|nr:hypothetical protein [Candidatus Eisenbacteria bacterium]